MHVLLDSLLASQHDCVARWQVLRAGWDRNQVTRGIRRAGLRQVHDGVWTCSRTSLAPIQRAMAATLTAPGTVLSHASAAALWGFGPADGAFVVVTRRGGGGPRRHGDVLVCRTSDPTAVDRHGVLVTPPARTLVDLAPHLDGRALRRAVIEALRLPDVPCTVDTLRNELAARPRRRGAPRLRAVVELVADLPVARTRSNAEGEALVRRKLAGHEPVEVNVRVGGLEADLVDHERREIIEIDGPAFHADPDEDARKEAVWEAAGYAVRRRPSEDAYDPDASW